MFKEIKGYEGRYSISDKGEVFSFLTNKILKVNISKTGYGSVELYDKNHNSKRLLVHRLVAEAFIDNPKQLPFVNHKDENKMNNAVNNLEWCSAQYNMNYGAAPKQRRNSTRWFYNSEQLKNIARNNGKAVSKTVLQFTKEGALVGRYNSAKEASVKTGANHSHITECCNGKRYKTVNGFVWRYEGGNDLLVFQY